MGKMFVFLQASLSGELPSPPLCATHQKRDSISADEWEAIRRRAVEIWHALLPEHDRLTGEVVRQLEEEGLKASNTSWTERYSEGCEEKGVKLFLMRQALTKALEEEGFTVFDDVQWRHFNDPLAPATVTTTEGLSVRRASS